ncbi:hypothetical protein BC830DRAFT_1086100, partial [Chytriomyces sp. MP71]
MQPIPTAPTGLQAISLTSAADDPPPLTGTERKNWVPLEMEEEKQIEGLGKWRPGEGAGSLAVVSASFSSSSSQYHIDHLASIYGTEKFRMLACRRKSMPASLGMGLCPGMIRLERCFWLGWCRSLWVGGMGPDGMLGWSGLPFEITSR